MVPEGGVVPVGPTARTVAFGPGSWAAAGNIAEGCHLQWLVVVLTPLVVVNGSLRRGRGVVAVGIRITGKRGVRVSRLGIVTVRIPVEALGGPVENPVKRLSRRRVRGELQASGELARVVLAENQVSVAR